MRLFIAVELDPLFFSKIVQLQKELPPSAKPVHANNMHFTMKFLGEVQESAISHIEQSLKQALSNFKPFSANLQGIGVFPSLNYIKVVWVGSPALQDLQHAIMAALPEYKDDHEGMPHLTLARLRSPEDRDQVTSFVKKHENEFIGEMNVTEVKIKKSTLMPGGPVYEDVKVIQLNKVINNDI